MSPDEINEMDQAALNAALDGSRNEDNTKHRDAGRYIAFKAGYAKAMEKVEKVTGQFKASQRLLEMSQTQLSESRARVAELESAIKTLRLAIEVTKRTR